MTSSTSCLILVLFCSIQTATTHLTGWQLHYEGIPRDESNVTLTSGSPNVRIPRGAVEPLGESLFDLWQEILFPEDEIMHSVNLVHGDADIDSSGSFCIYIPDENETKYDAINYHCARGNSQPCFNQGICDNKDCKRPGGICNCDNTEGFEGVNCGIMTANIDGPGCPLGCDHGTCVSNEGVASCECHPGFTGELCDKKAYYHECTGDGINVCITPFSVDTFEGSIYVKDHNFVPGCALTRAPNTPLPDDGVPDWCEGYIVFIDYNSSCGELGPNTDGNITSFDLVLRVQYAPNIITCTDELVTLVCQFDRNALQLSKTVLVDTRGVQSTPVRHETVNFVPAYMTLRQRNDSLLDPPLPVGFLVKACVHVAKMSVFKGVVIHNIRMNNTRSGDDYRDIDLYDNGCVPGEVNSVMDLEPYWEVSDSKTTICFQIKVFYFQHDHLLTSPSLGVVADVSVYIDAADAVMPTCGSPRRRREAGGETEVYLDATIDIYIPDTATDNLKIADGTSRSWLMPGSIAVGVVASIAAAIILVVAVCQFRRPPRKEMP